MARTIGKQLSITISCMDYCKLEAITVNEITQHGIQKGSIDSVTGIAISKIVEFLETIEGDNQSVIQNDKILKYLTGGDICYRWKRKQLRISLPPDVYNKMIELTVKIVKDTNKIITPNEVGSYIIHNAVETEMPDDKFESINPEYFKSINPEYIDKLELLPPGIKRIPEHDDVIDGIVLFNEGRDKKDTKSTRLSSKS